ncbi:MAG: hypothetical protein GX601_16135 [Anaerolineales bacterium]|nr:hypothetical protein [Anaerolineales bacterium]
MDFMKMVAEVERLYPVERLERAKARLRAVWERRMPPDRMPFVYIGLPAPPDKEAFDMWDGICSNERLLEEQLETIIDRAQVDDDYVPSLSPGCRQGTIPTAYGAIEQRSADHTWVLPMLRDPKDVYDLGHPDFTREGVAAELIDRVRFFRAATQGRVPIQMADMQGPLDLASNMWGTEPLMMAMYTDPDAVHHLLQLMTDAFIEYVRLLDEAAEGDMVPIHCMPVNWMPKSAGVALSEDLLAVISPRLYPTFARPYNEQVADAFGGVVIHSCGSVEHNLMLLAGTRGLTGVNFSATETALPVLVDRVGGKAVIISHYGDVRCNDLPKLTPEEHVRLCMREFRRAGASGIILVMPLGVERDEMLAMNPLVKQLTQMSGA